MQLFLTCTSLDFAFVSVFVSVFVFPTYEYSYISDTPVAAAQLFLTRASLDFERQAVIMGMDKTACKIGVLHATSKQDWRTMKSFFLVSVNFLRIIRFFTTMTRLLFRIQSPAVDLMYMLQQGQITERSPTPL